MRIGDIADIPITLTRTKQAANRLLNEGIARARKALEIGEKEFELIAKSLCRDFRILIEQVVETDLIDGIVRRYNPEVQTKGKIHKLAKITDTGCKYIDDMMIKHSRYEHSQPAEAPIEIPGPDELETDLKELVGFIDYVKNRN